MDIFFDTQGTSGPPVFSLTFDPEAMSLQCIADMASVSVQAYMERKTSFWNRPQFQSFYPVLFRLHGILYGSSLYQGNQGIGATLFISENFPLAFSQEHPQLLNLSFHCSQAYLQIIEEQRATNPSSLLTLGISLWATTSLVPTTSQGAPYKDGLVHIQSRQGEYVRISHSHWSDMLSSIGYPQGRYIELPTLMPQQSAKELHQAIEHLNQAHTLFAQDRYREAVQRCRQARDALLGEEKKTWWETTLAPVIGLEKAAMINEGIKALNHLGNEASHGAHTEIDRDAANYVIGSMTLILNYIGRKLR